MQYKQLFKRTYGLLRHSSKEWEVIAAQEGGVQPVFNDFVLPMAGLCALSAFLGILFQGLGFERALIAVIVSLGKSFGGVYFSFFALCELTKRFGLKRDKVILMQISAYGFVVVFVIDLLFKLTPELFFLPFFEFYTFYIIWEAVDKLLDIEDKKRSLFVVLLSLIILFFAFAIELFLKKMLTPGSEIVIA